MQDLALYDFGPLIKVMSNFIIQGVPKKNKNYISHPLLEFECPSTKLNPQVHACIKKLTTYVR